MFRVIQWATGEIGKLAISAMVKDKRFTLAGAYVNSPAKLGRDVGEIVGVGPLGVNAVGTMADVLAIEADCVIYAPLRPELDEICALLEGGKNVVTVVGYINPKALGEEVYDRLVAACRAGGTSFHGTGIHPGFAGDLLPLMMTTVSSGVEQIRVREIADMRLHPSRGIVFDAFDFGRPIEEARAKPDFWTERNAQIFRESQMLLAEALGVTPDRFTAECDFSAATERVEITSGVIEPGTVGGRFFRWIAWVGDTPKITFETYWRVVDAIEPDWGVHDKEFVNVKYEVAVDGLPSLRLTFTPSATRLDGTPVDADPGSMGRICTAMNAVNAIPFVVRAKSGIVTHLDMAGIIPPGRGD